MPTRLSKDDEVDIRASFEALDEEKTGLIDLDRFYVLWIGLGFDRNITLDDLSIHIPENRHEAINLDDVIRIISRNEFAKRDREAEIKSLLELIGEDGKLFPRHLVDLAHDSGDDLTIEEAAAAFGEKRHWGLDDIRNFMAIAP